METSKKDGGRFHCPWISPLYLGWSMGYLWFCFSRRGIVTYVQWCEKLITFPFSRSISSALVYRDTHLTQTQDYWGHHLSSAENDTHGHCQNIHRQEKCCLLAPHKYGAKRHVRAQILRAGALLPSSSLKLGIFLTHISFIVTQMHARPIAVITKSCDEHLYMEKYASGYWKMHSELV